MHKLIIFNFCLILFPLLSFSQDDLSLENAIQIGLENSFNIQIAKNTKEIYSLRNNFGNAGMSPQVSINSGFSNSILNSDQKFSSGVNQNINNANTQNFNASINLIWTLFDGLKMFSVKKRLTENVNLSEIQLKEQIETTVYNIMVGYYDIVKIEEILKLNKENLKLFTEIKKIADLKFSLGTGSKLDFLLAELDENKAKSTLIQYELDLTKSKIKLNTLLIRPNNTLFNASDSIKLNYNPTINELIKSETSNNLKLLISKKNEKINSLFIKEINASRMPTLQFNTSYNFTNLNSEAGFILRNQQYGVNFGFSLSWLLFNGRLNNNLIKERKLQFENQRKLSSQIIQEIDGTIYQNYQIYNANKSIMELETKNIKNAFEIIQLISERYKSGKITIIDVLQYNRNYEEIQSRYVNALYNAKIAEIELLRANGELIK